MSKGWSAVIAGAAVLLLSMTGFAQDGRDRLPERSTLLGSADTGCDGDLVIESGIEDDDDDVRRVRSGQSRVFEVENANVSWVCLGDNGTRSDTMECPADTTHVRIRREEDVATFECYGRDRR